MERPSTIMLTDHEIVGNGSYGKVFTGTHGGQRYAVKRRYVQEISPHGCIHVGEIDALCRFKHPHILRAKAVQRQNPINDNFRCDKADTNGNNSGQYSYRADLIYVLTEAADGDVWNMMRNPLPKEKALKYTWQLLSAITHMHDLGFIHRDVKPHNILFFKKEDVIKLCDFDMVLPSIEGYDSFKAMTPEYTPPEVLEQGTDVSYTTKVDVWGAGVILRYFLSGKSLLSRGGRRGDDMDRYLLGMMRKYFPNGSHIPAETCGTPDDIEMKVLTGDEDVDDLLSHMLDCNPDTRWDSRMCMSHHLFSSPVPAVVAVEDHVMEGHFITDDMAKVFDSEFNSLTESRYFGFFLGLDILMRVCRSKTRVDPRNLAIACFNIGMKYYGKDIAQTIPMEANNAKRIEYDIIVEKLGCSVYRDNVYNHIQSNPARIYRYMSSPLLSRRFPMKFSELCSGIKSYLGKISHV